MDPDTADPGSERRGHQLPRPRGASVGAGERRAPRDPRLPPFGGVEVRECGYGVRIEGAGVAHRGGDQVEEADPDRPWPTKAGREVTGDYSRASRQRTSRSRVQAQPLMPNFFSKPITLFELCENPVTLKNLGYHSVRYSNVRQAMHVNRSGSIANGPSPDPMNPA